MMFDTDGAICAQVDPEFFFPESNSPNIIKAAVQICQNCPLIQKCLTYALENDVVGIWAGTHHEQRKRMRKELGITAAKLDKQIWSVISPTLVTAEALTKREQRNRRKSNAITNDNSDR